MGLPTSPAQLVAQVTVLTAQRIALGEAMTKTKYEDGIHIISNDDYHASQGVSRSALWKLKQSPLHYWNEYINPSFVRPESNANFYLGSLVHTLVLEPEKFSDEYAVKPETVPLPKVGLLKDIGRDEFDKQKAQREAMACANEIELDVFNTTSEGKTIVSRETFIQAQGMASAVLNDDTAKNLLDGAKVEQSIYFAHESTGMQCKARPDAMLGSVVTDLKTCADASPRAMQSSAVKYGYYLQAGMIHQALKSIGVTMEKFVMVAVEKTEPYPVAIYIIEDEAIDYGVNLFDELIGKLKDHMESDRWPGYGLQTLGLPGYLKFDEV